MSSKIAPSSPDTRPPRAPEPSGHPAQRPPLPAWGGQAGIAAAALITLVALVMFTVDISNTADHFIFITRGRAVLAGEAPYRDFFDQGWFLHYYVTALGLALWPQNYFGDSLLCALFLAAGYVMTFVLAKRVTQSGLIALVAVSIAMLLAPRLYNYSKVFLYPAAVLLMWGYIDRPGPRRAAVLAGFVALAFLFRHDHGVFIGSAIALAILLTHVPDMKTAATRLTLYVACGLLVLTPFWLFLALNGGLVNYFELGVEMSGSEAGKAFLGSTPAFETMPGMPLLVSVVNVPNAVAWLYWSFLSWPVITVLVLAWDQFRGGTPAATPPALRRTLLCAAALTTVGSLWMLREPIHLRLPDVAPVCVVFGGWLLVHLRARALARFGRADTGLAPRSGATGSRWRTLAPTAMVTVVAALLCSVTWFSAFLAQPEFRIENSVIWHGPGAVVEAVRKAAETPGITGKAMAVHLADPDTCWKPTDRRSFSWYGCYGGPMAQYVATCTKPTDRTLFTWLVSEMHEYVGRQFAGGQPFFYGLGRSAAIQRRTIERMETQPAPIIVEYPHPLGNEVPFTYNTFEQDYPVIMAYLKAHYQATTSDFGTPEQGEYRIWTDTRRTPTGAYGARALPCFA